jgi:hypothetical protein
VLRRRIRFARGPNETKGAERDARGNKTWGEIKIGHKSAAVDVVVVQDTIETPGGTMPRVAASILTSSAVEGPLLDRLGILELV